MLQGRSHDAIVNELRSKRFAELVELVASSVLQNYVDSTLEPSTFAAIQRDMRDRFVRMFARLRNPISRRSIEWLADEHTKLAAPNGKQQIGSIWTVNDVIVVSDLPVQDVIMLRKLFPPDVSLLADKLTAGAD
jgi:hypothetical protein